MRGTGSGLAEMKLSFDSRPWKGFPACSASRGLEGDQDRFPSRNLYPDSPSAMAGAPGAPRTEGLIRHSCCLEQTQDALQHRNHWKKKISYFFFVPRITTNLARGLSFSQPWSLL